ncbi:ABC transporter permease [Embleya sp. NBC_00888]|nr:ABC transporter permease [Embleya sp. NBC_00888]
MAIAVPLLGLRADIPDPAASAVIAVTALVSAAAMGLLLCCVVFLSRAGLRIIEALGYPVFVLGGLVIPLDMLPVGLRRPAQVITLHHVTGMVHDAAYGGRPTLVGRLAHGDSGKTYAFIGAVAFASVPAVVTQVPAVITAEIPQGTMYRLRPGNVPLLAIMVLRSWAYLVEGLVASGLALFLPGPVALGHADMLRVAAAFPIALLTTVSCLCVGLFCCALGFLGLDEGMVVNSIAYLILLCSGAVVPVGSGNALHLIGQALPLSAGLDALRAGVTSPVDTAALHETVVAVPWLLATHLLLRLHARRIRTGAAPEPIRAATDVVGDARRGDPGGEQLEQSRRRRGHVLTR